MFGIVMGGGWQLSTSILTTIYVYNKYNILPMYKIRYIFAYNIIMM